MTRLSNWYGVGIPAVLMVLAWIIALGTSPPGCFVALIPTAASLWLISDTGRRALLKLQENLS